MRWAVALSLAACSASVLPVAPPSEARTGSWIFVSVDGDGVARALYAFGADALPDPLNLPHRDGMTHRLLVFDEPLEALMAVPDVTGHVAVLAQDAASEAAWPLPAPRAAYELVDDSYVAKLPDELEAWRATFRVPRPPCAPEPGVRAVEGLGRLGHVSSVVRRGDELLIGAKLDLVEGSPGGVHRLRLGELVLEPLPEFVGGDGAKLWLEGDTARVLWIDPARTFAISSIDARGVVTAHGGIVIDTDGGTVAFESIAAGFGDVVARMEFFETPSSPSISMLMRLDADQRTWRVAHRTGAGASTACPSVGSKLHLELDGPGRGLAGINNGPLTRFDLSRGASVLDEAPLIAHEALCRNARTTLHDGVELVTYSLAGEISANERTALLWRRPGQPWARVPTQSVLSGQALGAIGDTIFVGVEGHVIGVFEHVPSRPEIPPRQCHELAIGLYPHHALKIDERTMFISGYRSGGGVFLDLPMGP